MQRSISLLTILILIGFASILLKPINQLLVKQNLLTNTKCNQLDYEFQNKLERSNLEKFEIEIIIENEREWKKNILLDKIKSLQNKWNFFAYEKNNKRYKAKLYLYLDNELTCYFKAKIRAHGDLDDHRRGTALPSLNIHLEEGNLFGITKFILFRPVSRKYESEIFGANLLRELNFLSPRTMMVNVIYNKNKTKFIFQEKIVKEFLEDLNFVENPIYEADERFVFIELANGNGFFSDEARKLQKIRMVNNKIIINDDSHLKNSLYGLSILNELSHKYNSDLPSYWIMDFYSINNLVDKDTNYFKYIPPFDSFMYALNGTHGLAADDRRFYFDHINQNFRPIYYDGDFQIFDKNNFFDEKFNNRIINEKINKISPASFKGADEALSRLESLDVEQFYNLLVRYGSKLNLSDIKKTIEIIKIRLNNIKKVSNNNISKVFLKDSTDVFNNVEFSSDLKRKIIFNTKLKNEFLVCDIYGNDCKKVFLDSQQISKLISQELKIDNHDIVYIGKRYTNSIKTGWIRNENYEYKNKQKKILNNKISFEYYGDIEYEIFNQTKKIIFKKKSIDGRVIFNNLNIADWSIIFLDESKNTRNENILKNFNGLTGCLTFVDSKLKISNIYIDNSKCEDALNIIRSEGKIDEIKITNSISDGLDMDFSNIHIENLFSSNSKNDCADFSYGNYEINKAIFKNCGDKGISIGEDSNLKSNYLSINQSSIGISSKDSSEFFSESVNIFDTKTCLSAYNKKQEFNGGYMKIKKFKCENYIKDIKIDKVSKILIDRILR